MCFTTSGSFASGTCRFAGTPPRIAVTGAFRIGCLRNPHVKWTAVHLGELSDAQRASGEPWLEFPIIYVAAHQPHRFTKIIEELRVLVFFAAPQP